MSNKKINDKFLFIGLIGILICIILMMFVTIPTISHETEVNIVLSSWFFAGGGLFFLLLAS